MLMRKNISTAVLFETFVLPGFVGAQDQVQFVAKGGLRVTADLYKPLRIEAGEDSNALIILFHQAGSSRGEYREIAPQLAQLGYTVMAVDQRSGKSFNGVPNKTAAQLGSGRKYIYALPDMQAAITYGREKLNAEKVIIWGSSYSASLALVIAGRKNYKVDGVLAFSPGEYFGRKLSIQKESQSIQVPIFISAARNEAKRWRPLFRGISSRYKMGFTPIGRGKHGSSALLSNDKVEYWRAVEQFLSTYFSCSQASKAV